jgi:hypothetical protein
MAEYKGLYIHGTPTGAVATDFDANWIFIADTLDALGTVSTADVDALPDLGVLGTVSIVNRDINGGCIVLDNGADEDFLNAIIIKGGLTANQRRYFEWQDIAGDEVGRLGWNPNNSMIIFHVQGGIEDAPYHPFVAHRTAQGGRTQLSSASAVYINYDEQATGTAGLVVCDGTAAANATAANQYGSITSAGIVIGAGGAGNTLLSTDGTIVTINKALKLTGPSSSTPGNLQFGNFNYAGCLYSGGATVVGYNAKAFEGAENKVVVGTTNAVIGYDFINIGYSHGISFHTFAGSVTAGDTASSERMRITTAGNVGIGETAPDYKLDVNGTFGFTPGASVTPAANGDVVFELTNNTTLTVKAKGSDGTVRSGTVTLA